MKSVELRKVRDDFWASKAHAWAKPASLIVNNADDPTTMFNTAGMQPLVPYLMGKEHPTGSQRVYNIQGCVRTVDIDEVGDVSHLTYFEMMGNWSLGDYFKEESIARSREFLTEVLKLDKEMLCATIFEGDADAPLDEEAKEIWLQYLPEHRITALDKKENWRGPAGATGPCGPDSEIFYRIGRGTPPVDSHPGNDEDNWLEIWNNVFMGYYKDDKGVITEMDKKNVDTGMGFERILMVLKGQALKQAGKIEKLSDLSVYDIDIFQSFFDHISTYSFQTYAETIAEHTDLNDKTLPSFRIVADHLKTALFLIHEGLAPSNEGRGYVLRRIIRRGYYHLKKLCGEQQNFSQKQALETIMTFLCKSFVPFYPHLASTLSQDTATMVDEMWQFETTIQKGSQKIEELLSQQSGATFSGNDAFILYDTYGVPVELTREIVAAQGYTIDMDEFDKALSQAKEQSRAGAGAKFAKEVNRADYIEGLPETVFVGYDRLEEEEMKLLKEFEVNGTKILVFDRTPFYAEGGGQKGDSGVVELDNGEVVAIRDVQKYGGVYLHVVG